MACATLSGITTDCLPNLGGLKSVYLVRFGGIQIIQDGGFSGYVTDIALVNPNQFIKYDTGRNIASYTVSKRVKDNGATELTHTLNLRFTKRTMIKHRELFSLFDRGGSVIALVQDNRGLWWILGQSSGLKFGSEDGGSGTNKADGTSYSVSLSGLQRFYELNVPDSVVGKFITL